MIEVPRSVASARYLICFREQSKRLCPTPVRWPGSEHCWVFHSVRFEHLLTQNRDLVSIETAFLSNPKALPIGFTLNASKLISPNLN